MKIYLICSVRNADESSKQEAEKYVRKLESQGHSVHFPPRDVDQTDDGCGLRICLQHRQAMEDCNSVHVLFDPNSKGSLFDFGMAFALNKPIVIAKPIAKTPHKSYGNVLLSIGEIAVQ